MDRLEQYDENLPGKSEAADMFDEYKEYYSDIAELVKIYPRLAESLGIFAIMRGYKELELAQVITESIEIMKEFIEHKRAQEIAVMTSQKLSED